jgi:hypothetical protein
VHTPPGSGGGELGSPGLRPSEGRSDEPCQSATGEMPWRSVAQPCYERAELQEAGRRAGGGQSGRRGVRGSRPAESGLAFRSRPLSYQASACFCRSPRLTLTRPRQTQLAPRYDTPLSSSVSSVVQRPRGSLAEGRRRRPSVAGRRLARPAISGVAAFWSAPTDSDLHGRRQAYRSLTSMKIFLGYVCLALARLTRSDNPPEVRRTDRPTAVWGVDASQGLPPLHRVQLCTLGARSPFTRGGEPLEYGLTLPLPYRR